MPGVRRRCGPWMGLAGCEGVAAAGPEACGVSGYGGVIVSASKVASHASCDASPSVIGLRVSARPRARTRLTPSAGAAAPLSRVLNDGRSGCLRVSGAVAPSAAGSHRLSPTRRCLSASNPKRHSEPDNSLACDLKSVLVHVTGSGPRSRSRFFPRGRTPASGGWYCRQVPKRPVAGDCSWAMPDVRDQRMLLLS